MCLILTYQISINYKFMTFYRILDSTTLIYLIFRLENNHIKLYINIFWEANFYLKCKTLKFLSIQLNRFSHTLDMSLEFSTIQKDPISKPQNDKIDTVTPTKGKDTDQKSHLGRIYRTFCAKRHLKFRHQFPRMREGQIINKIIREWQGMSMDQKIKLGQTYNHKELYDSEEDDPSELLLESRSQQHKISGNQANNREIQVKEENIFLEKDSTGEKPIKIINLKIEDSKSQVNFKKEIKDEQDSQNLSSQDDQKQTLKADLKKQIGGKVKKSIRKKGKPLKKPQELIKLKNGEYILFYKHYYSRLQTQHPKWSSIQINHIVKLLWKKKQQQKSNLKQEKLKKQHLVQKNNPNTTKPKKPISGKEFYTREKRKNKLTKEQIDFMWKQLPRESKNDWNKRAAILGTNPNQIKNPEKIQHSLKTQGGSKNNKKVISFRDVLLKGIKKKQLIDPKLILEEKDQNSKIQHIPKQKNLQTQESQVKSKEQNCEYVSLATNPFSFMLKKISMEKIILE